jgi:hypothetical protein
MSYREEEFWLRFRGLSEEAQKDINAALPGTGAKQRGDIFLFEIHQAVEMIHLYATLDALHFGPEQFEVLASVVTTSDNGGIELPEYVLTLIRRTHCGVGFSFVDVGPDDQDEQ